MVKKTTQIQIENLKINSTKKKLKKKINEKTENYDMDKQTRKNFEEVCTK